jgi:hypothetical protein
MKKLILAVMLICGSAAHAEDQSAAETEAQEFLEQIYLKEQSLNACRKSSGCPDNEICVGHTKKRILEQTFPFKEIELQTIGVCCRSGNEKICAENIPESHHIRLVYE